MLYCDYVFELLPDGSILLDKELPLDHLKSLNLWDVFVLTETESGQLLLKRVDQKEEQFEPHQLELDI
jgi:hypothetical protein